MRLSRFLTTTLVGASMSFFTSCGNVQLGSSVGAVEAGQPIESERLSFEVERLTEGLEHPWGMAFLPEGGMLVTERDGTLRLVNPDFSLDPDPLGGVPTAFARGQGGLLDVALDPEFAANRLVYLSYSYLADTGGSGTAVARGRLGEGTLDDVEVIFRSNGLGNGSRHFGSRLVFDVDGQLYITHGDRGERALAQERDNHAGSVLRLNANGSVPADNPFVGQAEAAPEIFSYGHRNPQGMAVHPATGAIWVHEHGPRGGDEVNILEPGANFGWPLVTDGREYATGMSIGVDEPPAGLVAPRHVWSPSIAPSGMVFYEGEAFPEWQGDLLVGALADQLLSRLELNGDEVVHEEQLLEGELGRIRDVDVDADGLVYLLIDAADGGIYRLRPVESES